MFPLFITHDEYFVQCGSSGGGYHDVFDMSSYKLLSVRRQCGSSASAAVRWRRVAWRRCWQQGGGGGRVVAARWWQRGDGSVVGMAVWRQRGGGQRGGGVGQCGSSAVAGSVAAVLAVRRRLRWQQAGGGQLGGCGGSLAALQEE